MNKDVIKQQYRCELSRVCSVTALITMIFYCAGITAQTIDEGSASRQYRLGPEDELEISVWKEEDLTKVVVVRPDGAINFPLAGEIQVTGKSVSQVQSEITKNIRQYVREAQVTVSVVKVASYRIYVLGKVNNPGEYVLGSYVDVMQALTLADGLTPYASGDDIKILRQDKPNKSIMEFDYSEVTKGKSLEQNITLISGDIVVVP